MRMNGTEQNGRRRRRGRDNAIVRRRAGLTADIRHRPATFLIDSLFRFVFDMNHLLFTRLIAMVRVYSRLVANRLQRLQDEEGAPLEPHNVMNPKIFLPFL